MSIVRPICSISAESAVLEVCSDVADRPWWTLAYMGSCRSPRWSGGSSGESEFEVSLIGPRRGGGFGSRKSSGLDADELFERVRSSSGVLENRPHQVSDRRMLVMIGGFASRMDDGLRGDCGTSCELREFSEEEGGLNGVECDVSELDAGSDTVWNDGFSESGESRVTSTVAGKARLYMNGFGGGSLREGAPWSSTASGS